MNVRLSDSALRRSMQRTWQGYAVYHAQAKFKAKWASLIGLVGFPMFYIIWTYLFPQPYESLVARAIGFGLCCAVFFSDRLPTALRRFDVQMSYLTLLYCLPFFFTFMTLMNGASPIWQATLVVGLTYLTLLCDGRNFLLQSLVGTLAAFLLYYIASAGAAIPSEYWALLPILVFMSFGMAVLNYSNEQITEEKMQAAAILAAYIAHEMRTPLAGIKLDSEKLRQLLLPVLEGYNWAIDNAWSGRKLRPRQRDGLIGAVDRISEHATSANAIIDILLMNVSPNSTQTVRTKLTASSVIEKAIARYTFRGRQRDRVELRTQRDFAFLGNELLFIHVVFNLLKNGLSAIERSGCGCLVIETIPGSRWNSIVIRDTGTGMTSEQVRTIFLPFYSGAEPGVGTGVGLTFCKLVVDSFNGRITCKSEPGTGTEFLIGLPAIDEPRDGAREAATS